MQNCVAEISNMPCHAKHNQMGCVLQSCSRVFSLCTLCAKIAIVCANVSNNAAALRCVLRRPFLHRLRRAEKKGVKWVHKCSAYCTALAATATATETAATTVIRQGVFTNRVQNSLRRNAGTLDQQVGGGIVHNDSTKARTRQRLKPEQPNVNWYVLYNN